MKKLFSFVCALVCAMSLSAAVTYSVQVPAGTNTCYICGKCTGWKHTEMTKVDDTHYTITLETTEQDGYKYCSGPGWEYVEKTADGKDVSDRTYAANDVVAQWSSVFDPGAAVVYSIKHPWKDGADASWSYKDLTPNGDGTYSIRDIYGGKGCNWKSTVSGEKWVGTPTLVGEPAVGDSAIFTLTSTEGDGAITITKISSTGDDPTPDPTATYGIGSNLNSYDPTANPMTVTDGVATCTIALGTEDFKFAVVENGTTWLKNTSATLTRESNTVLLAAETNMNNTTLTPDVAGDYIFNFTIETKTLEVVYPLLPVKLYYGIGEEFQAADLDAAEDKLTASVSVSLNANTTYEFRISEGSTWYGLNEGTMDKDNCTKWILYAGNNNCKIATTYAGSYKFIWNYEKNTLSVEYPSTPSAVSNTEVENVTVKVIRDGQVLIVREGVTYNMMGQVIQ